MGAKAANVKKLKVRFLQSYDEIEHGGVLHYSALGTVLAQWMYGIVLQDVSLQANVEVKSSFQRCLLCRTTFQTG